ncbi:MAG TPA: PTS sugar transporter subunit IIA [Candidatus Aerophobetes bacterium]|uniref:PTS fructose transporter subunit IIA n=1 Tax=Aerophobetes bacterium TaxID=2030807 RepID=A0A662DHY3_UNCAE|nr:MAG: PTS fructose transporter subunit IIA [Candidatus Aerophobetes bacterium]HDN84666.1 PTS sugar transporter subunit IIA [Candidatus Aerophobetes bacterium]
MQLKNFLDKKAISPRLAAKTKEEVLEELVSLLEKTGKVTDREEFLRVIKEREKLGSTGIGYNIAIPHARSKAIKSLVGAFGISREGIDFDALDKEPVYLFFMLGAPQDASGEYLKALATVSRFLRRKKARQDLMKAETVEEIEKIIEREGL